jgi:hypothetical protein
MSIGLFIAATILFFYALAVRFAGQGRILNFVDYPKIRDRAALHAWVGHRLLGLAVLTALLGVMSIYSPDLALLWLLAFIVSVLVVLSWLVAGTTRFHTDAKH